LTQKLQLEKAGLGSSDGDQPQSRSLSAIVATHRKTEDGLRKRIAELEDALQVMKDKEAKARGLAATFRTHATKLKEQLADAAADAAAREDEVAEARRHQAKIEDLKERMKSQMRRHQMETERTAGMLQRLQASKGELEQRLRDTTGTIVSLKQEMQGLEAQQALRRAEGSQEQKARIRKSLRRVGFSQEEEQQARRRRPVPSGRNGSDEVVLQRKPDRRQMSAVRRKDNVAPSSKPVPSALPDRERRLNARSLKSMYRRVFGSELPQDF